MLFFKFGLDIVVTINVKHHSRKMRKSPHPGHRVSFHAKTKTVLKSSRPTRGKKHLATASFPAPRSLAGLPKEYDVVLAEIKQRIQSERLRVVMAANAAMVLLYWDIGKLILDRQKRDGWGTKIVDRLSFDLKAAYPEMSGLSTRNLKYMRAFAAGCRMRQLCNSLLHKYPGVTMLCSSTAFLTLQPGFGMFGK